MTIQNRFYNWVHGVKRYRGKSCKNVGMLRGMEHQLDVFVKYDWGKPMTYVTGPVMYGEEPKSHQWVSDKEMRRIQRLTKPIYDK
jgi:hypothetical protein